ncbi:hypothetical protein EST38_g4727 [Candolleomyces aberdarensis]|uniref:SGNH hydrolase-type esterase domain-containing protein n=1 Tax=Candolleomyces aberdarensis TaxID=2316362 RepID=A0A4Q2DLX7_9AGAR|nr:hypothetical protein EST38_g4727 [Candolleomyces aberdarensis]
MGTRVYRIWTATFPLVPPSINGVDVDQSCIDVYARRFDVLNRGLSGYNTEWGLPVFEQCLAKRDDRQAPKIRVLTIWFGANDACIKPSPQHVPIEKFEANIRRMIELVHSPTSPYYSPDTRIVLITAPPINTLKRKADLESRDPPLALDRLFDTTRQYAEVVKTIGEELNLGVVDVWTLLWNGAGQVETGLDKFSGDGLHLNGAGYEVVYDALIKVIAEKYPDVYYENVDFVFPGWKDINFESPNGSLGCQFGRV